MYITLISYIPRRGSKNSRSPNRLDAAKKVFQAMGAEIKDFFLVTGHGFVEGSDYSGVAYSTIWSVPWLVASAACWRERFIP
jgi:hypothetical protein